MKRYLALAAVLGTLVALPATASPEDVRHDVSAAAYEHLATAIIEIRATEDRLVEGILAHHHAMALHHLRTAVSEGAIGGHGKAAADEITAVANEGNKRVQAVRQRLLKAGHHHHTDAETEDDYIFIDSAEKKGLLEIAGNVAKAKDVGSLGGHIDALTELFQSAMKPE